MCLVMCNCFTGCSNNKPKTEPAGKETEPLQKTVPKSTTNLTQEDSSPSNVKTDELTKVFKVSSHKTSADIALTHGYELGAELGHGFFAKVYRARRLSDNQPMACKVMQMQGPSRSFSAKNELFIMERIKHPHVIRLHAHFIAEVDQDRYVFILMELAQGGSLSAFMRSQSVKENGLSEELCKRFSAQIISAVNYCHSKHIAHCDLKMGNILLDKDHSRLQVADFGLSRIAFRPKKGGVQMSTRFCGTKSYMAPEILLAREYEDVTYNPFVADLWSLGVLLYCIINQKYPFSGKDDQELLTQHLEHKIKFSRRMSFSPDKHLHDMFYRLLEPNVECRITMAELMVHPWIASEVQKVEENVARMSQSPGSSQSAGSPNEQR